ncbi:DUF2490 domain-containing protein [Winogradskyella sp.]|uniref:DUF2490 domain-containing protein n=1 Tax=Winogradskyella sp. TaxID=1883156 RepID=UPI003F6D8423
MYYIKSFLTFCTCLSGLILSSQNDFEGLGETSVAINYRINSDYKVNFAVRSRYYLYQDQNFNFENRQLDVVHFSTFNLDYRHTVSVGVQYRQRESIDGGSNELRFIQQFNFIKKNLALRFGHRISFEQRLLDDLTILRSRYRFALDFPLNGEKLNIGEKYLVTSMEALLSNSEKVKPKIDHRTTAHFGWLVSKKLKLQLGLEYRFESLNINTEEKLFLLTSFILKI